MDRGWLASGLRRGAWWYRLSRGRRSEQPERRSVRTADHSDNPGWHIQRLQRIWKSRPPNRPLGFVEHAADEGVLRVDDVADASGFHVVRARLSLRGNARMRQRRSIWLLQ